MDDGYMPSWNDCYAKINEMYKENLNLRESIGRLETKLSQAQTMIDELERLKIAHKQLIASQRNYINVLTKKLRDSTEKLNDLTIIYRTQRSIIFDQKDVIHKQYNIINSIWTNRNTILGIPKEIRETISELINPHSA